MDHLKPNFFGKKNPVVRLRDGHVEHVCKYSGFISVQNGVDIRAFVRKN